MSLNRAIIGSILLSMSCSLWSIELPDGFIDESFIDGIRGQVTGFDWAGDDEKIFIALKSGIVRVAVDGVMLDEAFIDLSETVNDRVDRGLLSVAVHPEFPNSPYIYLLYTYDPPELAARAYVGPGGLDGNGNRVARLDRYAADVNAGYNRALSDSLEVMMGTNSTFEQIGNPKDGYGTLKPSCGDIGNPVRDCLPIDEMSHTIGAVRFATDGSLYVTNGDGASYHDVAPFTVMVQDLNSMRGKVFRIDAETGQGLADNPFYDGDPNSNRSKVLSFGLRNPYSLAIHPKSGVPYVGDVGWDLWEEINGGIAKNFAWPCYSGAEGGNQRRPDFEDLVYCQEFYQSEIELEPPVLAWPVNDAASAMVGDFYFADSFPENYEGKLFYADFLQGWMRYADVSDPNDVKKYNFATDVLPLVELKLGVDGALYYASITTGEIRRIRYTSSTPNNTAPSPVIFTSTSTGIAPLDIEFDASNSSDTDGSIVGWYWDFGNGQISNKEIATTTFGLAGEYTVVLTVTDNAGASATAQTTISVEPDNVSLTIGKEGLDKRYAIGEPVRLSGFATVDKVKIDSSGLTWQANIYNGEDSTLGFKTAVGESIEFAYPDHVDSARVQVCLQSNAASVQKCELLSVESVTLELDSYPLGLPVVYESSVVQTPFTQEVPKGAIRQLSLNDVDAPQFVRWSDGGADSHAIELKTSSRIVANFAIANESFDYASAVSQAIPDACLTSGSCWQFYSNIDGDVHDESSYVSLLYADGRYSSTADDSNLYLGKATSHSGLGRNDGVLFSEYAIARYVVKSSGEYAVQDSFLIDQNNACGDGMEALLLLNGVKIHYVSVNNGEQIEFNYQLGTLKSGDVVIVALGPEASSECDTFAWQFSLQRQLSGEVAPAFQSVPTSPLMVTKGEELGLSFVARDANGDVVSYTSRDLPANLKLNAKTGRVTGYVNYKGTFSSVIVASDGTLTSEYPVVWEVTFASNRSNGGIVYILLMVLLVLLKLRQRTIETHSTWVFR